jgi:hypothetical protein
VRQPEVRDEISPRIKCSSLRFKCNSLLYLNRGLPGGAVYDLNPVRHKPKAAGLAEREAYDRGLGQMVLAARDRGKDRKTTGYYVPHFAEVQVRQGVEAWSQLQDRLRELATLNKERLIPTKTKK